MKDTKIFEKLGVKVTVLKPSEVRDLKPLEVRDLKLLEEKDKPVVTFKENSMVIECGESPIKAETLDSITWTRYDSIPTIMEMYIALVSLKAFKDMFDTGVMYLQFNPEVFAACAIGSTGFILLAFFVIKSSYNRYCYYKEKKAFVENYNNLVNKYNEQYGLLKEQVLKNEKIKELIKLEGLDKIEDPSQMMEHVEKIEKIIEVLEKLL